MKKFLFFGLVFSFGFLSSADNSNNPSVPPMTAGLYRPNDLKKSLPISDLAKTIQPGQVLLLGEIHYQTEIQKAQLEILKQLRNIYLNISLGWEFASYTLQKDLDAWKNNVIDDAELLSRMNWDPKYDFLLYKPQLKFPFPQDYVLGLNAPRSLTKKIAIFSLKSLTPLELILLPPQFDLGRPSYFKRFEEVMKALPPNAHPPTTAEEMQNRFEAQSVWDDTMAWKITEFMGSYKDQVLVALTGAFHVKYGGGLPDRLLKRNFKNFHTVVFIPINQRSEAEIQKEIQDDPTDGPIADWIYLF